MNASLRRTIAASEIFGGAFMIVLVPLSAAQGVIALKWWYALLLICLGASSVAAGAWLWRGDPRGFRWSKLLQALQILQVRTSTWGFALSLGLHVNLYAGKGTAGVEPGVHSVLDLRVGAGMPWLVVLNVFSLAAFVALARARDREPAEPGLTEGGVSPGGPIPDQA